uniref:Kinase n=1 Tax=Solanum tuberosum TaxID=4113 RepID=M1CEW8_SOLTU
MAALDYLVTVDSYPKPDDKIRSTSFQVHGGGNIGNAMTCAARLGLTPRSISKVADDSQGKRILNELEADGIDTSFIVKTRTSIYTPEYPPMVADDLPDSSLSSALDDMERGSSIAGGLISMLLKLPSTKFVIATLGEDGCVMIERAETGDIQPEEVDIDDLFEKKQSIDTTSTLPTCKTSDGNYRTLFKMLQSCTRKGLGLCVGTAEKIPSSEIVDTTGAGDAFVGAVLYSLCANFPPEKMLIYASQVAAIGCRALGARDGLPHLTDPRLLPFLA